MNVFLMSRSFTHVTNSKRRMMKFAVVYGSFMETAEPYCESPTYPQRLRWRPKSEECVVVFSASSSIN